MTDHENQPAGTADLLARLLEANVDFTLCHEVNACIEQLGAALTRATQNNDMMFVKGMRHGQQVMKDTRRLVIVDSPELVELREALTRANAATAAAYEVAANVDVLHVDEDGNRTTRKLRFLARNCIRALATPDQTAALDKLIAEAVNPYVEALAWYGEQARLARLIHSEGDAGRNALQADGGKRAAAILAASKKGGV